MQVAPTLRDNGFEEQFEPIEFMLVQTPTDAEIRSTVNFFPPDVLKSLSRLTLRATETCISIEAGKVVHMALVSGQVIVDALRYKITTEGFVEKDVAGYRWFKQWVKDSPQHNPRLGKHHGAMLDIVLSSQPYA